MTLLPNLSFQGKFISMAAPSTKQDEASYPSQPYPAQPYPAQPYPAQPYPAQPYPAQAYPTQSQPYPMENSPPTYSAPSYPPPQSNFNEPPVGALPPAYGVGPSNMTSPAVAVVNVPDDSMFKDAAGMMSFDEKSVRLGEFFFPSSCTRFQRVFVISLKC